MNHQIQLMLQQALKAFQSGNIDGADLLLKRILQVDSKNFDALHIFGVVKASQSKFGEAADFLSRAARIQPNDASLQYNLAKALADSGNDKDALAHHKKAVALAPNNPEAWINYGLSMFNLDYYEEALACYDKALSLKPDYAEAWSNKANVFSELKRYDEALAHYDEALSLKPDYAEAWSNKGATLSKLKECNEALAHYEKALSLKPGYAEAWSDKGNILSELNRYVEALAHYDKALSLKPDYAEALFSKGNIYRKLKRYDEALAHYDRALSLKPDHAEAWSDKGNVFSELKRYDEALAHYDKALNLNSDICWTHGDLAYTKMRMCDWSDFSDSLKHISKKLTANEKVISPFVLLALNDDALMHKKSSEIYVQSKCPFNPVLGPVLKPKEKQKIRVGYFSADFRNHAVSILTAELFELHDKNRFEIIAFSFGIDDKSAMRLRLSQTFNQFIDVNGMSDLDIAKLSRKLSIDIAVDLGGHTAGARTSIFAHQAAPIQVSYLGYLGTIGAKYFDYIFADNTIIPEHLRQFYTEKIVYLPSYQVNDRKRYISDKKFTRADLSLPETGFVFCCFNNNYKILPATFDGWMRILKAVDGSVLFLYAENHWAEQNLKNEAIKRGVDGSRLVFGKSMPSDEYLARYQVCDLFLDTFPYNAGTTASDALWAEIPVLTLSGESFASRMAASILNAVGLPELITNTQKDYEELAIELAMNPKKFTDIKLKLVNNRMTTHLFNTPLFTKNIEAAFIRMYGQYQNGLQPEHIFIT